MSKFKEIVEVLKKYEVSVEDFAFEEVQEDLRDTIQVETGTWEEVHQRGGEGQGDHWESIKYFKEHDLYIKVAGHYTSHYGTDFGDWEDSYTISECRPKEKTITVYN